MLLFHSQVSSLMCLLCITVEMDAKFAGIQVPGRLKETHVTDSGELFVHDSANEVYYTDML